MNDVITTLDFRDLVRVMERIADSLSSIEDLLEAQFVTQALANGPSDEEGGGV